MNYRQNKILKDVFQGNYNTLLYYHKEFNVSKKSIRNDINEINSIIEKPPKLEIQQGRIIFANNNLNVDLEYINSLFTKENLYTYRLSQEERQIIIVMILLNAKEYKTIASLSELFDMSRNTISNDMEKVKKWFIENGLQVIATKSNGFKVKGNEKQIRFSIVKLLMTNGYFNLQYEDNDNSIFFGLLLKELDKKELLNHIEKIINKKEEEFKIEFSDFYYKEIVYYCLVLTYRIKSHESISNVSINIKGVDYKKHLKYEFTRSIVNEIENKCNVVVNEYEIYELVKLLESQSYIKNNILSNENKNSIIRKIEEFIFNIGIIFKIDFSLEVDLYNMLVYDIVTVVDKAKRGYKIANPLLEQLKNKYLGIFKIIKKSIKGLEEYMEIEFCENEISFIVMHTVNILEIIISNKVTINILIVCNSGRCTEQLIFRKLQNSSSKINVVNIVSSRKFKYYDYDDNINMIVSTVPLKDIKCPYVLVSTLIVEKDFLNIQTIIGEIINKHFKNKYEEINLIEI